MWQLLDRKTQVTIIVTATAWIFFVVQTAGSLFSEGTPSALKVISFAIFAIATVLVAIFNFCWRWFWRNIPFLGKVFFPDLNGTWKGTLQTSWKNPETGLTPGPIDTIVWIRQSLLSISVRQQTKESPSWSTRMFPDADIAADRYRLWYSYENKPHANVAHTSPDHEGVACLEMNFNLNPNFLKGQYYTSRSTTGNMEISRVSKDIKDFADQREWFSGKLVNDFRHDGK